MSAAAGERLFLFVFGVKTHDAIGHEVMPVELPATVVLLVKIFNLGDQIFQLHGQRDENLLAAPRPRSGVQDLYVDRVSCRGAKKNRF